MLGVNNLGVIEGRGVGGGGRNSCFILTHDNPLPNLNGPFHRNTERQWNESLRQLLENIPPDISTWIPHVWMLHLKRAASPPLKINRHNFHCEKHTPKGRFRPKLSAFILVFPWFIQTPRPCRGSYTGLKTSGEKCWEVIVIVVHFEALLKRLKLRNVFKRIVTMFWWFFFSSDEILFPVSHTSLMSHH